MSKSFGQHYLVELIGCDPERIKWVKDVEPVLRQAAADSRATVVGQHFHQFDPVGVTGVILIAESHFTLHTWPQDGYVSFDVLTCGDMDAPAAIERLKQDFAAREARVNVYDRGF